MKLFIWRDVLTDWTPGIIFAMAHDVNEAREKVKEAFIKDKWDDFFMEEIKTEPEVHDKPFGAYVFGGA